MKNALCTVAIVAALGLAAYPAAAADEQKFEMRAGESVKTLLDDAVGRQVTLLLASGQEVTGTVAKVGDNAVHLSRIAGREFFDAVVRLDRVDGVIQRVRGK